MVATVLESVLQLLVLRTPTRFLDLEFNAKCPSTLPPPSWPKMGVVECDQLVVSICAVPSWEARAVQNLLCTRFVRLVSSKVQCWQRGRGRGSWGAQAGALPAMTGWDFVGHPQGFYMHS